jgi:2-polyprenyl-3-methyl-5-hydroxy-6-metoxy-1,4-benzoquinol methylase
VLLSVLKSTWKRLCSSVLFSLRHGLRRLHDKCAPPELVLMEHATAFWRAAAVLSANELKLADALTHQPLSLEDWATNTNVSKEHLRRLAQCLMPLGYFEKDHNGLFRNSPLSNLLRTRAPKAKSLHSTLRFQWKVQWQLWQLLPQVAQKGLTSTQVLWNTAEDKTLFDYLSSRPQAQEHFHEAMQSLTALASDTLLEAYPWENHHRVMDLGGGKGTFVKSLLKRHPHLRAAILDLPHAFDGENAAQYKEKLTFEAGSFFDLKGKLDSYDAVILKHILHDWKNEDALRILNQVSQNCKHDCTILIIETLKDAFGHDVVSTFADLEMMHSFQSEERTKEEFEGLLARAGLECSHVFYTLSPFKILACRKTHAQS